MQQFNDLHFVLEQYKDRLPTTAPQLYERSDGGWDHSPRVPEKQAMLVLDHLEYDRDFSWSGTSATGQQVYSEAERLNGAETLAVARTRISDFCDVEPLLSLPPGDRLQAFGRQFQLALVNAISGATYAKNPVVSLASNEDVPGSDPHDVQFRSNLRLGLNGKLLDINDEMVRRRTH